MCERKHREKEKCNIWCQRNALVNGIHGWTIKYWLKTETKQKEFTAAASRFFFFAWRLKIKVLNRKQKAVNCCLSFVYLDACCWRFFFVACRALIVRRASVRAFAFHLNVFECLSCLVAVSHRLLFVCRALVLGKMINWMRNICGSIKSMSNANTSRFTFQRRLLGLGRKWFQLPRHHISLKCDFSLFFPHRESASKTRTNTKQPTTHATTWLWIENGWIWK